MSIMSKKKQRKEKERLFKSGQIQMLEPIPGMRIRQGHVPKFWQPLDAPDWVAAEEAERMRPDDPVIGFHVKGQAYAIPWWNIKNHHVANLDLDGTPVLVMLCEACSSLAAYYPVSGEKRFRFRVTGAWNGTFTIRDEEEETSYWSPVFGKAVHGPLTGTTFERFPVFLSIWKEWAELYPETRVPYGKGELKTGHGSEFFPGSPSNERGISDTLPVHDERLPANDLVLGVRVSDVTKAYPLKSLPQDRKVINESIGDDEIAVFYRPGSWMATARFRKIGDRTLNFETRDKQIIDVETGSAWNFLGECIEGEFKGEQLPFVWSMMMEWHLWPAHFPETLIYGIDG